MAGDRGGESLQDFSLNLLKLLRKVEIATPEGSPLLENKDDILNERFSSGLADASLRREVRRYVQENPGIEFSELRNRVISWESPPPPPPTTPHGGSPGNQGGRRSDTQPSASA